MAEVPRRAVNAIIAATSMPEALAREALQAALDSGEVMVARCSCPVGFGHVRDSGCAQHGVRVPAHTITGAG